MANQNQKHIPFHVYSIPKPQLQYNFDINNSNTPFSHRSLPHSQDRLSQPIHPADLFNPLQFASHRSSSDPIEPPSLGSTPLTIVQDLTSLNHLAAKLAVVDEFGVDLESNSYCSFQGMTCLIQFSTRTEDFIVDALVLRAHVGDVLGKFFLDPNKKKVFHGAINDMVWLQRDFHIYVVNMFDTMQASRVMNLERNSLEHLLKHYCGVTANKQYQRADWRIRPLPCDMVKYAREDTHYLLYIYDLMRRELVSGSAKFGFEDPLGEAYKRSHEVCTRLYKKEVYDKQISYLYVHGLGDAKLDAQQLAIVAGLSEWRDKVAREEDEGTGYVLPNKELLEIAKKKPLRNRELLELVGYSKAFVLRDANKIIEIIWASIYTHAPKFEKIAEQMRSGMTGYEIAMQCHEMKNSSSICGCSSNVV